MKNYLNKLFGILVVLSLFSCSGKDEVLVKPETVNVKGDLKNYLKVVENEYEIVQDFGGNISIKMKAVQVMSEQEIQNNEFTLTLSLLDEKGMPVSGVGEFKLNSNSRDKITSLLKSGNEEEVLQFNTLVGDYNQEEHGEKVEKFVVSSSMKPKEESYNNSNDNMYEVDGELHYSEADLDEIEGNNGENNNFTNSESYNNSSTNFNELLTSYESYIDQYIRLFKKARNNDLSALSEYPSMMEKANDLQQKIEAVKGQLTQDQLNKFIKLQQKLMNAASNF
ncbi:hypothetical protein KY334_06645 [Candidatus Woesearchaeota archaeon]|nr:hypothetical protein [Candidatus Woesearchaeota archaeon]